MNLALLKQVEERFLLMYPKGFEDEEMKAILKKHNIGRLTKFSHEAFTKENFKNINETIENMIKLVSRSSMISMFEKPKFRDNMRALPQHEKEEIVNALDELLFGDEEKGFHVISMIFQYYKMAKWTTITCFRCYYYPETDFLVKPTTTKNIIKIFELENIKYHPTPTYNFYCEYRKMIRDMSKQVDKSLSPTLPAFTGFLMSSM